MKGHHHALFVCLSVFKWVLGDHILNACRTSTLPIGLSPRPRESLWEKFTTNIFDPLIMHVKNVRTLFMGVLVYLRKWNIAQMKCNSGHVRWPKKSTNYFETQHCGVSWNFSICLIRSTPPTLFCPLTLMPTTCIYVGGTMKNGLGSWLPWVACQPDCEGHRLVGWFSPQRIPCWVPAMAFWTCSF